MEKKIEVPGLNDTLFTAVGRGDLVALRQLISQQISFDIQDENGATPLELAIRKRRSKVADLLLASGADPDYPNALGMTPLMVACQMGFMEGAEPLVLFGNNLDVGDKEGKTALMYAILAGHQSLAKFLIRRGADVERLDQNKRTAIFYSVICLDEQNSVGLLKTNHPEGKDENYGKNLRGISQDLINQDAKVDLLDGLGQGPIHYAAQMADEETLVLITESGADLNLKNQKGEAPVEILRRQGKADMASNLEEIQKKPEVIKKKEAKEAKKEKAGSEKIVRISPANSKGNGNKDSTAPAEINKKNAQGETPLMLAAKKGDLHIISQMIDQGADVNLKDFHGNSALIHAIKGKHLEATRYLATFQKNMDSKDGEGLTPMAMAVMMDWPPGMKELLVQGASIKLNVKGMNLLMLGATHGAASAVHELLLLGLSPKEKDYRGRDALFHARINNNKEVEKVLLKWLEKNQGKT